MHRQICSICDPKSTSVVTSTSGMLKKYLFGDLIPLACEPVPRRGHVIARPLIWQQGALTSLEEMLPSFPFWGPFFLPRSQGGSKEAFLLLPCCKIRALAIEALLSTSPPCFEVALSHHHSSCVLQCFWPFQVKFLSLWLAKGTLLLPLPSLLPSFRSPRIRFKCIHTGSKDLCRTRWHQDHKI